MDPPPCRNIVEDDFKHIIFAQILEFRRTSNSDKKTNLVPFGQESMETPRAICIQCQHRHFIMEWVITVSGH